MRYTEISYLEIIRLFGIPFFLILIFGLLSILSSKKIKKDDPIVISFIIFLLIGGTNPLLINATGTLVISYFCAYIGKIRDEKIELKNRIKE